MDIDWRDLQMKEITDVKREGRDHRESLNVIHDYLHFCRISIEHSSLSYYSRQSLNLPPWYFISAPA